MSEKDIQNIYENLLEAWNKHDAKSFARLFKEKGNVIGFDGSQLNGMDEIEKELSQIFNNHQTAPFISKIREIRFVGGNFAILRAIAGMTKANEEGNLKEINPDVNAIQTLIASKENSEWKIELFQNTPAAFHGRPELVEKMTEELQKLLN